MHAMWVTVIFFYLSGALRLLGEKTDLKSTMEPEMG